MHPNQQDRPYLTSWLRRTRRQLAASGRLSELALILSRQDGRPAEEWSTWLRAVLDNEIFPTLDELTTIDTHLAQPKSASTPEDPPFRLL